MCNKTSFLNTVTSHPDVERRKVKYMLWSGQKLPFKQGAHGTRKYSCLTEEKRDLILIGKTTLKEPMLVAATFRNSSSFMLSTSPSWLMGFRARLSSFRRKSPRPSTVRISLLDNHSTSRFVRCAIPVMRLIRLQCRKSSFSFRQFPRPSILHFGMNQA